MRTIIVGFDSFDPGVFESLHEAGRMPNLARYVERGGYSPLEVCSPPQTEVSWTSIATGVDPGSHGIFDFVHRDPKTYVPYVSLLPTKQSVLGEQFLPPYTTKTLFHEAADMGYPATALWWPALFPARPEIPVATIPGLGTPDIRGQLGVGTYLTTEPREMKKTKVIALKAEGKGNFTAELQGPQIKTKQGMQPALLPVRVEIRDDASAFVTIGDQKLELALGKWSHVFEVKFKAGFAFNVHAITQAILTQVKDGVSLYLVPLQIHPLHALWHYATPPGMVKDAWKVSNGYLTVGWPQDTNALEDGCINDEQFIGLCDSIFQSRKSIFFQQLDHFQEGVLAGIFDCLDRVQHMFTSHNPEVVHDWYARLDGFVAQVEARIGKLGLKDHRLLVLSDHGFRKFEHKVHLNHWLAGNGYMSLARQSEAAELTDVQWEGTKAYALGLNSVYLNVANREGRGTVLPEQIEPLLDELKSRLLEWRTNDGQQIVSRVLLKHEAFSGPYARFGPDLVMGYAPGFRASSETGLGKSAATSLEPNHDHWGADHCIDSTKVPGVLFANREIKNMPGLSFRDIPFLALGKHLDQSYIKPPSEAAGTGQKDLEERLKGLGYL
jgi:predicted AlkP superfamily phosphohydrolase/phosphomutase